MGRGPHGSCVPPAVWPLLACLALAPAGCRSGPTLDEAQALLRGGDPAAALDVARRASAGAAPEERAALRRFAFQAAIAAGLPREAAREYQLLRRLAGRDDDGLLGELAHAVLRRAVTSDDPARRLRGVEALELLGADPRAVALLRTARTDAREEVRAAAARAAAALPDRAAAAEQLSVGVRDPSPWVRRRALEGLVGLEADARRLDRRPGDQRLVDAGALVRAALTDPDEDVRLTAVGLVPRVTSAATALLVQELGRGSDAVRCAAALELLRLDPSAVTQAWLSHDLPAAGGDDPVAALGLALRAHGDGAALAPAREALRAPAYGVRLMTARGLAGPAAARLVAPLRAAALDDPVRPVRAAALEALLAGAPEEAPGVCRRALAHADPGTRRHAFEALEALGALGPDDMVRHLGDPALTDAAARWLAARGGEPGFQALVAALDAPAAAEAALEALAEQGDRRMRARFVELLTSPGRADARVLRAAALGVARCGEAIDRPLLLAMLERGPADLAAASALLALQARAPREPAGVTTE
ncbi:MAG: hypothetical protein M9894_22700 [Planctomycetes bacterium]|nr:hypothetical protein [Planctomycetota bacterium]